MYEYTNVKKVFEGEYFEVTMTPCACEEELERLAFEYLALEAQIEEANKAHDTKKFIELEMKKIALNKSVIFFSNGNVAYFNNEVLPAIREMAEC